MKFKEAALILWNFCKNEIDESYKPGDKKSLDEQIYDYYYRQGQRLIVEEWCNKYKNSSSDTDFSFALVASQLDDLINNYPLSTPKRENKRRFVEESGKRSIKNLWIVYNNSKIGA